MNSFCFPDREMWKKILTIILPITLQNLLFQLDFMIDAAMLGRIGQEALASVSIAGQVQMAYGTLLGTFCSGISIFVSQYWGKKDPCTIEKLMGMTLHLTMTLSLLFFVITLFFPGQVLRLFTDKPLFIEQASVYLRIIAVSYFFLSMAQVFSIPCRSTGHVKELLFISCLNIPLDILLNYLFIYRICGPSHMGVDGAAIATVIVRFIGMVLVYLEFRREKLFRLRSRYLRHFAADLFPSVMRNTLPIFGNFGCYTLGVMVGASIMGHQEPDAVAASSLVNLLLGACCILSNGMAGGVSIILGTILGSGDMEKAKKTGQMLMSVTFLTGVFGIFLLLGSIPFLNIFAKLTPNAAHLAAWMILLMLPWAIPKAANGVLFQIFNTGGQSRTSFHLDLIATVGITIPVGLFCAFVLHLPALYLFFAVHLDELLKLPMALHCYWKYAWLKNLTT